MVEFLKQLKETAKSPKPKVKKDWASQKFTATILVTYVTILTEPDLPLQNQIRANQYDFCSIF